MMMLNGKLLAATILNTNEHNEGTVTYVSIVACKSVISPSVMYSMMWYSA